MSYQYSRRPTTQTFVTILRRDPCSYCGRILPPMTIDHIRPRRGVDGTRGGRSWRNLTSACDGCNTAKANTILLWFLWALSRTGGAR